MNENEITVEYIIEQSKIVDEQTLKIIIENYGNQEYEKGSKNSIYDL